MACFDDGTLDELDALAWLDAPSTSDDDLDMLLLTLPPIPTHEPALQHQGFSPPQLVPKALAPFPRPQDAPAAAMQGFWGPAQQPWGMQEPCTATNSTPVMDLDSFLGPDALVPAGACQWDAPHSVPAFYNNSAGQLGSLQTWAPQHLSTAFFSGPSALPAAGMAQLPTGTAPATWGLGSSTGAQRLPPVVQPKFQPLPRSARAGMGRSASPVFQAPEACITELPRAATSGSLSAAGTAATVAAVLAAAAGPAAPAGQGTLECNPSLASTGRSQPAALAGGAAVHTLPLPHDTGSAGSAPPAAAGSSMPHGHARAAVAAQAAMLAAGGPSLPAPLRKPSAAAPTAGQAVSAVPRSSGSGSRGSPREMVPLAARLSKPVSGAIAKPLPPAQVQRKRSGVEEALQAAAVEAQESKTQALTTCKALLQSTVQGLKASGAELAARLDNLTTEVTAVTTNNQQLKAANRQVKAQVQALVLQLQHAGVSAT